jgi:hypothetical protein
MPRAAQEPTQPSVQWVLRALSLGMKLIAPLNLLQRLRMNGATPLLTLYGFVPCTWTTLPAFVLLMQKFHLL